MRFLVVLFVLWPIMGLSQSHDYSAPRINDFQAGIFCAPEVVETVPAPGTVSGESNILEYTPDFVSTGRNVPAVLGMGFGVKSSAKNVPIYNVTVHVTHPPMGPNGVTEQTYTTYIDSHDLSVSLYQFDYGYELVEGLWTMTALDGEDLLYRASFNVVPPNLVPDLASVCHYEHLLG